MTSRAGPRTPSQATSAIRSIDDSARTWIAPPWPARRPEALRPEADLGRRLLAGRVEDALRADQRRRCRPRPGGGASTCRSRARRRGGRPSPARGRRRAPGRARRSRPAGAARSGSPTSTRRRRRRRAASRGRRALPSGRARGSRPDLGLDEAVPGRAGAALALPAEERFAARLADEPRLRRARRLAHREPIRRPIGQASTGVSGSAAWMSRPASGSRSTTIVVPGSYLPSRRCSARTSSTMFWMTRRSGRAPYATS